MKYTYATLPVVGEYDGLIKDQKVRITNRPSDSELCSGRTNGSGWSFHGGSCSYKGKHVHENVMVEVIENGETTVDVRTVRFCGTHDPIRYAERKRDEYLAERKSAESEALRQRDAQKRVDDMVREINELAGGKVVESGWASYGPSVRLYNPQSLLDALRTLAGQEEERIAS
jgi:hypothetical protein